MSEYKYTREERKKVLMNLDNDTLATMIVLRDEELDEIERLKKQSNDYAKRIIKAIEYIEENCTERGEGKWAYRTINADNTLNILKGADEE